MIIFDIISANMSHRGESALGDLAHGETDPLFPLVHLQHRHLHHVSHGHHLGGVPNELVSHLGDVNQAVLVDADVHKGAEVDDVANGARQHHAGL